MSTGSNQPTETYADLNTIISAVSRMTLPPIKQTIKNINDSNLITFHMSLKGLKKDLVERLSNHFTSMRNRNLPMQYRESRRILEEQYGVPLGGRPIGNVNDGGPSWQYTPRDGSFRPGTTVASYSSSYMPAKSSTSYPSTPQGYSNSVSLGSSNTSSGTQVLQAHHRPHFRPSPFLQIKEWIGPMVICSEALGDHSRSVAPFNLRLESSHLEMLRRSNAVHQLRLFCTNKTYYDAAFNPSHPAPVEFPVVCEVKVNNIVLSVNLKGKKTAAKVLAPNINKDNALYFGGQMNKIELIYEKTIQKYVLSVAICEVRNADTLARRIRREKFRSKSDILGAMKKAADDDDIEMGDVSIGLKCPLSYMRLSTPIRSTVCVHMQCFDALSFFSINEQTPAWQCPFCFKSINPESLFLDGYVQDILDKVPKEEETVLIDAEGRWHTPNNKYSSEAAAAAAINSNKSSTPQIASTTDQRKEEMNGTVKSEDTVVSSPAVGVNDSKVEIFEIDDDDEEEESPRSGEKSLDKLQERTTEPAMKSLPPTSTMQNNQSKNPAAPAIRPAIAPSISTTSVHQATSVQPSVGTEKPRSEVIDLTFSDSEEDDNSNAAAAAAAARQSNPPNHAPREPSLVNNAFRGYANAPGRAGHGAYPFTAYGAAQKHSNGSFAASTNSNAQQTSQQGSRSLVAMNGGGVLGAAEAPHKDVGAIVQKTSRRADSYDDAGDDDYYDGNESQPVLRHRKKRRRGVNIYADEEQEEEGQEEGEYVEAVQEQSSRSENSEGLYEDERAGLAVGI